VDAASRTEIESHAASGDTRAQLELASLLAKAGDDEGTRTWLERAAKSGDPLSCTLLGEVLLSRAPYDVPRGASLASGGRAAPTRPRKSTLRCACHRAPIPSRIRRITRNTGL